MTYSQIYNDHLIFRYKKLMNRKKRSEKKHLEI